MQSDNIKKILFVSNKFGIIERQEVGTKNGGIIIFCMEVLFKYQGNGTSNGLKRSDWVLNDIPHDHMLSTP